jgi:AraC family transcriptional regulator
MQTERAVTRQAPSRPSTRELHQHVIERAILAMRQNIDCSFPLERIAKSAMCSPFHFNRVFRQMLGVTPTHFLSALRLQTAKKLLLTTSLSVIDVCFEAGYNSLGSFTTRFTQLVGVPPNRLRKLGGKCKEIGQLVDKQSISQVNDSPASIFGTVTSSQPFDGPVFIGLFKEAMPQGAPVSCTIADGCGNFRLPAVDEGEYFLFAAGLPWSEPAVSYLLSENILRASSGRTPLTITAEGPARRVDLVLRGERLTDPPILIALPLLLNAARGA